jgi:hypothetical protein
MAVRPKDPIDRADRHYFPDRLALQESCLRSVLPFKRDLQSYEEIWAPFNALFVLDSRVSRR